MLVKSMSIYSLVQQASIIKHLIAKWDLPVSMNIAYK